MTKPDVLITWGGLDFQRGNIEPGGMDSGGTDNFGGKGSYVLGLEGSPHTHTCVKNIQIHSIYQ